MKDYLVLLLKQEIVEIIPNSEENSTRAITSFVSKEIDQIIRCHAQDIPKYISKDNVLDTIASKLNVTTLIEDLEKGINSMADAYLENINIDKIKSKAESFLDEIRKLKKK